MKNIWNKLSWQPKAIIISVLLIIMFLVFIFGQIESCNLRRTEKQLEKIKNSTSEKIGEERIQAETVANAREKANKTEDHRRQVEANLKIIQNKVFDTATENSIKKQLENLEKKNANK